MNTKITVVKKVKADGNLCRQSAQVLNLLQEEKLLNRIDCIVFAQENQPTSSGMVLAQRYDVKAAPFFIVERGNNHPTIYIDYITFFQDALNYYLLSEDSTSNTAIDDRELDFFM